MPDQMDRLSLMLAGAILLLIVGGIANRLVLGKGFGSQFNRGMVATLTVLVTAILALNEAISPEAVTLLLGGSAGYALGVKHGTDD